MDKKSIFTKILAVIGTAFAWFPIFATLVIAAIGSLSRRRFMVDYLMPAELFPIALLGAVLLVWAALRARRRRALIIGGLVAAIGLLFGSQGLAVMTGLASGETEAAGWPWAVVITALAGYTLALILIGIGGFLLLRDLLQRDPVLNSHPMPGT